MSNRFFLVLGALAIFVAPSLPGQTPKIEKNWSVPRTADGHPDLQGIWTNVTITPTERPAVFAGKATVTDAEAKAYEQHSEQELKDTDGKSHSALLASAGSDGTGGYNVLFVDRGSQLARVDGVKRTSLIIDPPNGKMPPMTAEGKQRMMGMFKSFNTYDSVKDRPTSERCLIGFGSTSGPPMLPVLYNNNYQIVQTPDNVMILVEMVHDARIIRINGTHAPANIRQWFGDSIGHWEGDTLVVDTTNFSDQPGFYLGTRNLHVIERFTRVGPNDILYKATVDDPSTFEKQWTMEFPFVATAGPIYEYACHEGNYAMSDIMGGARQMEKK
jgi:hypothetical protein